MRPLHRPPVVFGAFRAERADAIRVLAVGWILGVNVALWLMPHESGWLRVLVAFGCGLALTSVLYAIDRGLLRLRRRRRAR